MMYFREVFRGRLPFSESACVRRDVPSPVLLETGTLGILLVCVHLQEASSNDCHIPANTLYLLPQPLLISVISLLFLPLTASFLLTQDNGENSNGG